MKDIVIIGAGGVGREVALMIDMINNIRPTWNLIGYLDDNENNWGMSLHGKKILGGIASIVLFGPEVYAVVAISNCRLKKKIVKLLESKCRFATIIHPRVQLHDFMTVGEGTIIYEGAILTTDIKIGSHVLISPKCGVGHDSVIGNYSSLLWNVNISGKDNIEEQVLIGSAATVIQNLNVGRNAIIGAGSVVVGDIPPYTTSVGVPSRVIKREEIYEEDIICNNR